MLEILGVLGGLALIFVIIVCVIIIIIVFKLNKMKKQLNSYGLNNNMIRNIAKQTNEEIRNQPKSINGIEPLVKPRLRNDFPDLSIENLKKKNLDEVYAYYNAIEEKDHSHYLNNKELDDKILRIIKDSDNVKYSKFKIHSHSISKYEKINSITNINFQIALEYNKDINGRIEKVQDRIETVWIYLPEANLFSNKNLVAFNCENCGAPISKTKDLVCSYCQSKIELDFTKTFYLKDIEQKN